MITNKIFYFRQNRLFSINRTQSSTQATSIGQFSSNVDQAERGGSTTECSLSINSRVCQYCKYAACVCLTSGAGYGIRAAQDAIEYNYCNDKPSAWKSTHVPFDSTTTWRPH